MGGEIPEVFSVTKGERDSFWNSAEAGTPVTEFTQTMMPGGDLLEYMRSAKPITEEEFDFIMEQLIKIFTALQKLGWIHDDLIQMKGGPNISHLTFDTVRKPDSFPSSTSGKQ